MEAIKVMLIETDLATIALTESFFAQREDVELCAVARDGVEALDCIRRVEPEVVLLELALPGLDGLGFLRTLKENPPPRVPMVIVTSYFADPQVIRYAVNLGAQYYLIKPINYEELPRTIGGIQEDMLAAAARRQLLDMGAGGKSMGLTAAASAAALLAGDWSGRMLLKEAYSKTICALRTDYTCVEKNIRYMVAQIHQADTAAYRAMMGEVGPKRPGNERFLHQLAEILRNP